MELGIDFSGISLNVKKIMKRFDLRSESERECVLTSLPTSANWGPDLTFVDEASSTRLSSKLSSSRVIKSYFSKKN